MTFFWKIIRPEFFVEIFLSQIFEMAIFLLTSSLGDSGRESRDGRGSDPPSSTRPEPGPKLLT